MPITITLPQPNQTIGPGHIVRVDTTFGAPSTEFVWQLRVTPEFGSTDEIVRLQKPSIGFPFDFLELGNTTFTTPGQQYVPASGTTSDVQVDLVDPVGTVVDTGHRSATWDSIRALWTQVLKIPSAAGQGLTELQAQQLATSAASVVAEFATNDVVGGVVSKGLDALVNGPPSWLLRRTQSILLTGKGSLDRPGGGFPINAYGGIYEYFSIPFGFGSVDGTPTEFFNRMVRLAVVKRDAGENEYYDQVVDASHAGAPILWSLNPGPIRVDYTIAPGVTIAWHWLIMVAGQ